MTTLFSPLPLRQTTAPNRLVPSPVRKVSADDRFVNDWHLVTVGRYTRGEGGIFRSESNATVESS